MSTKKSLSSEHPKASVIVHTYSPELILVRIVPVDEYNHSINMCMGHFLHLH